MERITDTQLRRVVDRINDTCKSPMTYMLDGVIQVGHYHLYSAYGRTALHRTMNTAGGAESITGLATKRELYNEMHAFLKGVEAARS